MKLIDKMIVLILKVNFVILKLSKLNFVCGWVYVVFGI